ncbi:MAG: hypothetical protein ABI700_11830 [Chloroflexota bacterium]
MSDLLLFARFFEFSLDMTLQDSVDRLMSLTQPQTGFLNASRRTVEVQKADEETYTFEIRVQRYSRGFTDFTNAKCVGLVFKEQKSEGTFIQGKITAGIMMPLLWISLVAIFLASLSSPSLGWSAILVTIGLVYGLQSWLDRRKLRSLIYEAFQRS